jgi:stringent starvation protein B
MIIDTIRMAGTVLRNFVQAGKVLVIVDSTVEGVELPKHLLGFIRVKLNLSTKFKGPLDISTKETKVTLSFSGEQYNCVLPHHAVYYIAMADDPLAGVEIIEHTPIEIRMLSEAVEDAFSHELALSENSELFVEDQVDTDMSERIVGTMLDAIMAIKKDQDLVQMIADVAAMCSDPTDLEKFLYAGMGIMADNMRAQKDLEQEDRVDNEIDFESAKKDLDPKKD